MVNVAVALSLPVPPSADPAPDGEFGRLVALARSRSSDDRQRLLLAVASLCDANPPGAELSPVLSEIFMTLARQAEREIRAVLAQRLATADWAPQALIHMLALDEIEIARPVIAASPLLKDDDLLRILVEATLEHHIEVARRPNLSGRLADAVIDRAEPAVLTALAGNRSAQISEEALRRLVDSSRRIAGLRAPLTRHPRLNQQLATQLYQWVGQALRQSIAERFRIDEASLDAIIQVAADRAAAAAASPQWRPADPPDSETERRLIDKLKAAGQLRPGFAVRAVREGRRTLFEHALAAIGEFPLDQIRAAVTAETPQPLYLACVAAGIDRTAFLSLLTDLRRLTDGRPGEDAYGPWTPLALDARDAARLFNKLELRAAG
ncbi:DUF2336 domain-containing protein [Brevundimonas sp.]|uniref:DUF2336 domain-containing protein n=1 Tax=Brevundimonas sp. TaxID=1871086 RepID=UPI0025BF9956|nr:DUF2336 domain-containing protein [Brevundimonas sp.]